MAQTSSILTFRQTEKLIGYIHKYSIAHQDDCETVSLVDDDTYRIKGVTLKFCFNAAAPAFRLIKNGSREDLRFVESELAKMGSLGFQ